MLIINDNTGDSRYTVTDNNMQYLWHIGTFKFLILIKI